MLLKRLAITFVVALATAAAQPPLPGLRVEPIAGGSDFYIKNTASQPITAFILELAGYPGSGYVLVQDESSTEPIAPGAEKHIHSTNMTPGAVPEYMKLQAALYADGTSAGSPEKVAQLVEHRQAMLETTRGLIGRIEKAKAAGTDKAAVAADLKQWADSIPQPTRRERLRPVGINQEDSRGLIQRTAAQLDGHSLDDALAGLRTTEKALAATKPAR